MALRSRRLVGVQEETNEGVAAVVFGTRTPFEHARQNETARAPRGRLLADVRHDHVRSVRRGVVDRAKTLGLNDDRPAGETEQARGAFLFTHHIADEAHAATGEPAKFFRILEPAISDGAVEFSEREVGNALRCRRERSGRGGGLQRGEREF
jgi:hypothetical protein